MFAKGQKKTPQKPYDVAEHIKNPCGTPVKGAKEREGTILRAPVSRGLKLLISHLFDDARLSTKQAILAQCCQCMGYYSDGRDDCDCPACPLYKYMPYGKHRKVKKQAKIPLISVQDSGSTQKGS